jgi:hypothetical protein
MDANRPLSEQHRLVGKEYNDVEGAAHMLEELKSATLAQWMLELGDMPVSKAEMLVKGSKRWKDYIEKMCAARKRANLLKIQLENIKMRFREWESEGYNRRAEMSL